VRLCVVRVLCVAPVSSLKWRTCHTGHAAFECHIKCAPITNDTSPSTGNSIYSPSVVGCLHDPANVRQTSSKCIQNTRANAGRSLDRVNTIYDYTRVCSSAVVNSTQCCCCCCVLLRPISTASIRYRLVVLVVNELCFIQYTPIKVLLDNIVLCSQRRIPSKKNVGRKNESCNFLTDSCKVFTENNVSVQICNFALSFFKLQDFSFKFYIFKLRFSDEKKIFR